MRGTAIFTVVVEYFGNIFGDQVPNIFYYILSRGQGLNLCYLYSVQIKRDPELGRDI